MTQSNRQENPSHWAHPIEAVAFDMDGLLVNTEELYTIVGDTILQRRGQRFTPSLKDRMMGLPAESALQIMIDDAGLDATVAELEQESGEIFLELLPSQLELLPGLPELLELVEQKNLPRCVATSSSRAFAKQVLGTVKILDRFDFVITAQDVSKGKPAPDIYHAAAERMSVATQNMLVLEDSHHGATAGVLSGACTIAVPGEHSINHDFQSVAYVADQLSDPNIKILLT